MAQNDALLFLIEVDISIVWYRLVSHRVAVEEPFHRLPILEMRGYYLRSILRRYVGIKNALRLNDDIWSLLAKAMATGKIHRNILHTLLEHLAAERLENGVASTGDASGTATNINGAMLAHIIPLLSGTIALLSWDSYDHESPG